MSMRFISFTTRRIAGGTTDQNVVLGAFETLQEAKDHVQAYATRFYADQPAGSLLLLTTVTELNESGDCITTWDIELEPTTVFQATVVNRK